MPDFAPQTLLLGPQIVANHYTQNFAVPGMIISVSDGVRTASAASGLSDVEDTVALHHSQSFKIGSQTKMMTGMTVLELAEEGLIDLDCPLARYLDPALITGVANADIATVRQALQMRTGIPNYTAIERPDGTTLFDVIADNPDEIIDADHIIALLQDLPATGEVGQDYEYSNTNYLYLSKVIEAVTGQELGQVFHERIFEPLGMRDTYLEDFRENPDLVSTYLLIDGELVETTGLRVDAHGEGGVVSTTDDMITFLNALLVDQTLTSATVLAAMTDFDNAGQDPRGFAFSHGLGLMNFDGVGTFVGFAGGIYGSDSATYLHIDSGRIIASMVNLGNGDVTGTGGIISIAATLAEDETWQQDPVGDTLYIDGISAADLTFETLDGVSSLVHAGARFQLSDHIISFDSDDFVFTDGSMLYLGGPRDDVLMSSGAGNDQLLGFGGNDLLIGAAGTDHLRGGAGADILFGRGGDDRLVGGGGSDFLKGQRGDDLLLGGAGDDILHGNKGNDVLQGGRGGDILRGGKGDDRLNGGHGSDRLNGQQGDDQLFGGRGNDRLLGGPGDDVLTGGGGADMFVFRYGAHDGQTDHDVITDYQVGLDRIALTGRKIASHWVDETGLTLILDGGDDTILLQGLYDPMDIAFV